MLVYIRESDKDKIICNVDEKDIAEHLRVSAWFYLFIYYYQLCEIPSVSVCGSRLTYQMLFQIRLKREQEEKEDKRRYKAQAHLFTIIKVMDSYLSILIFMLN
jgi:ubiquitin carboxyl-terminal hydrolase 7